MQAFKRRGIFSLCVVVFIALVLIEGVKSLFGWQTGTFGNAVTAGCTALVGIAVLRHLGFHPFARGRK